MDNKIWFGIPGVKMQWTPAPLAGAEAEGRGYFESMEFENGGSAVRRSQQFHRVYNFEFFGKTKDVEGIEAYNKFASGYYGTGLVNFAHPYAFETNLFSVGWSSPGLIENGWRRIYDAAPTFVDTAANSYDMPSRSAVFSLNYDPNYVPTAANSTFTIPIPPDKVLHLGVSGSRTGTGVVRVQPINANNSLASTVDLTLLSATGATRLNATFSGATYQAVRIYLTRTSNVASTVTLTSLMAQLWDIGVTPQLTGNHVMGQGHTALQFGDDARVEEYRYIDPPMKGMNTTLVEVGAWA